MEGEDVVARDVLHGLLRRHPTVGMRVAIEHLREDVIRDRVGLILRLSQRHEGIGPASLEGVGREARVHEHVGHELQRPIEL